MAAQKVPSVVITLENICGKYPVVKTRKWQPGYTVTVMVRYVQGDAGTLLGADAKYRRRTEEVHFPALDSWWHHTFKEKLALPSSF